MNNPPRPAPKPGRVKVYRALYDYVARSESEMSFMEGDLVYVADGGPNADWLQARCGNSKGLVPANYVVSENVEELANPLHEAARRGNVEFLKDCINNQVSVNSLDRSGSTALYWACHGGHVGAVETLLATPNISVSAQNKIGDTALHASAWKGHAKCVELLLSNGANPLVRNQQRQTAMDVSTDADSSALLSLSMKSNTQNSDTRNDYESESDDE